MGRLWVALYFVLSNSLVVAAPAPQEVLSLVNSPLVEHGAIVTEFGVYVTRKTGRWGESGRSTIVRLARGADTSVLSTTAAFADPDANESSPYFERASGRLCFLSDRPHSDRGRDRTDADIWCVRREAGGWTVPRPLPEPVNTPGREYSPVLSATGSLFFASDREGGLGRGDLYEAKPDDDGHWEVKNLGPAINRPTGEWNLGLSPDGSQMIFEASSRPENLSIPGDLYFSTRNTAGWHPAVPLSQLNSGGSDLLPRWLDGETLLFASSRKGGGDVDILVAETSDWMPVQPVLAAVARSSGELVLLDPLTLSERSRIPVGTGPHELAASQDGRRALVPLLGIYPEPHQEPVQKRPPFLATPSEGFSRVDLATGEITRFPLPGCARPHGVAVDAQAARAWVTCEAEGMVLELSAEGADVSRRFDVGKGVHKVIYHPLIDSLVTSNPETGEVHRIHLADGRIETAASGPGAEGLVLSRDGRRAWVSQSGDGTVCRLALEALRVDWCQPVGGGFPIALALLPDLGQLWVSRLASGSISILSAESGELQYELTLPSGALNLAVNPAHGLVYAALPRRNEVIAIRAQSREIVATGIGVMEVDDLDLIAWPHPDSSPDT
ncbi:MAG: hypothetical protein AAF358_16575 [Pseudomonadota bacterium]